ncbi:hypothetical protein GJAV_G00208210 [Gymnothorax javanicus]|nr:hypothetical protein GJAV_G00208210 [Gymnothorax javanicus]
MATSGGQKVPKSDKLDEAQALAKSCAGRPDFLPCDGLSICATHSHGKCFKLHWCCHLGWCHCKYVYQPMTSVGQLPSTPVPTGPSEYHGRHRPLNLTDGAFPQDRPQLPTTALPGVAQVLCHCRPLCGRLRVKRVNGKMCYVQRPPPALPSPPPQVPPQHPPTQTARGGGHCGYKQALPGDKASGPKIDHCTSPSSSEDSGINALGLHYLESCDDDSEESDDDEDEELSSDGDSSPGSLWGQDECTLLSPSKSIVEIIEKIETTV